MNFNQFYCKFDANKIGDDEILVMTGIRNGFERHLDELKLDLFKMRDAYDRSVCYYNESILKWTTETDGHSTDSVFMNFHLQTKIYSIKQV